MRLAAIAWGGSALALCAGAVACFDLFHSTAGIEPGCEIDARECRDGSAAAEAGDDAGATDFCAWSPDVARASAAHACAWLGACESPLGGNAFGECMFSALLAYDCTDNPNHPALGAAHAYWDCLWQAQSCGDVERCVFPAGTPTCGSQGDYTACDGDDVRIECTNAGRPLGESCASRGQVCAWTGNVSVCAGAVADAGGLVCTMSECAGARLHWCADGGDVGIDCASTGAGACGGFPSAQNAEWAACLPAGDAGCDASTAVQCASGYATSCPAGVAETINCQGLLQVADAGCSAGTLSPPFDWTSPCVVSPPRCTADSCDGTMLTGCARGARFTVDCSTIGSIACQLISTDVGTEVHAVCAAP